MLPGCVNVGCTAIGLCVTLTMTKIISHTRTYTHTNRAVVSFLQVTLHIILNMFSIATCLLAMCITALYSTATRLPEYDDLETTGFNNTAGDCLFSQDSPLYSDGFRDTFSGLNNLVSDCRDLSDWWRELLAIACLCLVAALVSFVGSVSNCTTPCLEQQYHKPVKQYSWDISNGCGRRCCFCCSAADSK